MHTGGSSAEAYSTKSFKKPEIGEDILFFLFPTKTYIWSLFEAVSSNGHVRGSPCRDLSRACAGGRSLGGGGEEDEGRKGEENPLDWIMKTEGGKRERKSPSFFKKRKVLYSKKEDIL